MPIEILMPALSPTMESGKLAKWHVKAGDKVEIGDVIAEIETDKATMEVESADEGTVGKILVDEGEEDVKVNAVIGVLLEEGESESDIGSASAPSPASSQASNSQEASKDKATDTGNPSIPQPSPVVDGNRIFASPLARRIASQNGVDISQVKGSGPHGRIVKRDVEGLSASDVKSAQADKPAPVASSPAPAPMATAPSDEQILKLFKEGQYEIEPHDNMRKTIARRLSEAKQTVPHFYLTIDCKIDKLLALRKDLNANAPVKNDKPAYKLSVNDFIIKAHALALMAEPNANASWLESGMALHKHADVGVAVAIPGGLITPIIRKAEIKSLSTISNEMKDMARRAKDRKLKPEEYQGGTTSVSNLGMFGIKEFDAVINPPHGTILAIGAGREEPVVDKGEIKIANVMSVTLSVDHRAVDGALGAQLLQAFKGYIENPMSMLV